MCWHTELELAALPEAPSAVRAELGERLGPHLRDQAEVIDDVQLVATELITNAVRAHANRVGVVVELHRDELVIRVVDDGTGWPAPRGSDPTDHNGRGLTIVAALTDQWGVNAVDAATKQVWASMALPAGSLGQLRCER